MRFKLPENGSFDPSVSSNEINIEHNNLGSSNGPHYESNTKPNDQVSDNLPVKLEDNLDLRQRQETLSHLIKLQNRIIDEFNLSNLEKVSSQRVRQQITIVVTDYAKKEGLVLNQKEVESLVDDILDEMNGLGPLEPLIKDATVNDILINGHETVFVERGGKLQQTEVRFKDEAHLLRIIHKIVFLFSEDNLLFHL